MISPLPSETQRPGARCPCDARIPSDTSIVSTPVSKKPASAILRRLSERGPECAIVAIAHVHARFKGLTIENWSKKHERS